MHGETLKFFCHSYVPSITPHSTPQRSALAIDMQDEYRITYVYSYTQ